MMGRGMSETMREKIDLIVYNILNKNGKMTSNEILTIIKQQRLKPDSGGGRFAWGYRRLVGVLVRLRNKGLITNNDNVWDVKQ